MANLSEQDLFTQETPSLLRFRRMMWVGLCLYLVLFVLFVVFSNFMDWDAFYTYHEVDLRSWLLEYRPPLWSHQLCAGVTRAGDPQGFGLSPLFAWVLLLGSFWGTKWMVLFGLFVGIIFFRKILYLLAFGTSQPSHVSRENLLVAYCVVAFFLGSNAFLWHLSQGHVSYALLYLALGILYFTLKAWFGLWRSKDGWIAIPLVWSYYSAGFYLSQMFFLLPLFLAFALLFVWQVTEYLWLKKPMASLFKRWSQMVGFHLAGMLLASYKLYFIFQYQRSVPRTLNLQEYGELSSIFQSLFLPTWNEKYLGLWSPLGAFGMWEHSAFHLPVWGLFFFLLWFFKRRLDTLTRELAKSHDAEGDAHKDIAGCTHKENLRWFWRWLIVGVVLGIGFSLGDGLSWGPHAWLNHYVFQRSVRVIPRYQIVLVFLSSCAFGLLVLRITAFQRFFLRWLSWPMMGIFLINLFTFYPWVHLQELQRILSYKRVPLRRMTKMLYTKPTQKKPLALGTRLRKHSFMYRATLLGFGMPHCFTPLAHKRPIYHWMEHRRYKAAKAQGPQAFPKKRVLHFMDIEKTSVSVACLAGSYFTQQMLSLHKSCPRRLCLNINQPNLYKTTDFAWDQKAGKFCRKE